MLLINFMRIIILFTILGISTFSFSEEIQINKDKLNDLIKDYILENPEILLKSIENYRKNVEKENERKIESKLFEHYEKKVFDALPYIGNKKSSLLLVEFIDYNCGYCKKTIKTVNKLVNNIDNLKIAFIDFPILSDTSLLAAKAALAAESQDSYFAYHSKLLEYKGPINEEFLISVAEILKLDIKIFKEDMISQRVEKEIKKNLEIARSLNIRGTPTFLFKDYILAGAYEYEKLESLIKN